MSPGLTSLKIKRGHHGVGGARRAFHIRGMGDTILFDRPIYKEVISGVPEWEECENLAVSDKGNIKVPICEGSVRRSHPKYLGVDLGRCYREGSWSRKRAHLHLHHIKRLLPCSVTQKEKIYSSILTCNKGLFVFLLLYTAVKHRWKACIFFVKVELNYFFVVVEKRFLDKNDCLNVNILYIWS
jgi:hypothetical protein